MVSEFLSKFITIKFYTSPSVSERKLSPVASTTALGVSAFVALAQTPTVGSMESTRPIASYPTSGPRSLLPSNTKHSCCNSRSMDNFQTAPISCQDIFILLEAERYCEVPILALAISRTLLFDLNRPFTNSFAK